MTKVEQLADVARGLTGQQIDGLIEYGHYLQAQPHYATASTEVLASIDRGLEDAMAGRVHSLEAVLARIDKKLDAGTSSGRSSSPMRHCSSSRSRSTSS